MKLKGFNKLKWTLILNVKTKRYNMASVVNSAASTAEAPILNKTWLGFAFMIYFVFYKIGRAHV